MAVGHTSQRGYNQSQRNTATHLSRLQGKMLFKSLHYFAVKWSYNFYQRTYMGAFMKLSCSSTVEK